MAGVPLHFADRLTAAVRAAATPAVVGIDPVLERLPAELQPVERTLPAAVEAIEAFSRTVLELVAPAVPVVKINSAFFEAFRAEGVAAYYRLVSCAHSHGLIVIGDVKRGDIGSTARLYARGHLGSPAFADVDPESVPDAVTLAGYLGENAVRPFIDVAREQGRGVFVLVRPSDPGADEVHDFAQDRNGRHGGRPLRFYEHMARLVRRWGEEEALIGECGLSCVGALVAPKDPRSTAALRASLPQTPFLVPGYGAQGAGAAACRPCFLPDGTGAIVNASRSVIYAFENDDYHVEQASGLSSDRPEAGPPEGSDWRACIEQAARDFAADVGKTG